MIDNKEVSKLSKGKAIKHMRKTAGFTQKALGEKLEITESAISMYESEVNNFSMNNFQRIAKECDFEILIYDKDSEEYYNVVIENKDEK